jgi:hypothetical protein
MAREQAMNSSGLKHRQTTDPNGYQVWTVAGPSGAITWGEVRPGTYSPIEIHSPRPMPDHRPAGGCTTLEMDCYFNYDAMSGANLGDYWAESGRAESVIWSWLEDAYRAYLAGQS